jgi:hypothetical protein
MIGKEKRSDSVLRFLRKVRRFVTSKNELPRAWQRLKPELVYAKVRDLPLNSLAGDSEL